MITKTNNMIDADDARTRAKRIPIYHPTLPKLRPQRSVRAAILAATVFGTLFGVSGAHAQTALTSPDPSMFVAQQSLPGDGGDRRGPPPREAVAACANRAVNSACSFEGRGGDAVKGVCRAPNADAPAACAPTNKPQNG